MADRAYQAYTTALTKWRRDTGHPDIGLPTPGQYRAFQAGYDHPQQWLADLPTFQEYVEFKGDEEGEAGPPEDPLRPEEDLDADYDKFIEADKLERDLKAEREEELAVEDEEMDNTPPHKEEGVVRTAKRRTPADDELAERLNRVSDRVSATMGPDPLASAPPTKRIVIEPPPVSAAPAPTEEVLEARRRMLRQKVEESKAKILAARRADQS